MLAEISRDAAVSLAVAMPAFFIVVRVFFARRHDPFRQMTAFRLRHRPQVRFHRLDWARFNGPRSTAYWYQYTLATALDDDWVYLRFSLIPFFPAYYRLPREHVRPWKEGEWTVIIDALHPPLKADMGEGFLLALTRPVPKQKKRRKP